MTRSQLEDSWRAAEHSDWEGRFEEFCEARAQGIQILKAMGDTEHEVESREILL